MPPSYESNSRDTVLHEPRTMRTPASKRTTIINPASLFMQVFNATLPIAVVFEASFDMRVATENNVLPVLTR